MTSGDPGSLVTEGALGDTLARLRAAARPVREVDGWATVELDRAERELGGSPDTPGRPTGPDTILGAFARRVDHLDRGPVVLLEPSTEGPLAAALARHGEGWLVRYVVAGSGAPAAARADGLQLSAPAPGPFGIERLVLGGPRSGPFLLLVEG